MDYYDKGTWTMGIIAFLIIWIYAIISWGFLVGLAIGWLPALIGGFIAALLWPLIALGIIILIFIILASL
jgi:hypothetical protein